MRIFSGTGVVGATLLLFLYASSPVSALRPVLIIPGFMGSILEWPSSSAKSGFEQCWVNPGMLITRLDEWLNGMKLTYDPDTDTYGNSSTHPINTFGFGDVTSVSTLGSGVTASVITYFQGIVSELISRGYTPGVDLRAAPFDWRLCPFQKNNMGAWWDAVEGLIEEMAEKNGVANQTAKVVIIGHSMGGVTGAYFLAEKSAAWKDKYVDYFITMAAPLGGAVKALAAIMSGSDFGLDLLGISPIPYLKLRETARTWASVVTLLPNMEFGAPLVVAGDQKYGLENMKDAIIASGATANVAMMNTSWHAPEEKFPHPGVPVYCTVGSGHKTFLTLHYPTNNNFDIIPDTDTEDGDGTVLKMSADRCREWEGDSFPFKYTIAQGATHVGIVRGSQYYLPFINDVIFRQAQRTLHTCEKQLPTEHKI